MLKMFKKRERQSYNKVDILTQLIYLVSILGSSIFSLEMDESSQHGPRALFPAWGGDGGG